MALLIACACSGGNGPSDPGERQRISAEGLTLLATTFIRPQDRRFLSVEVQIINGTDSTVTVAHGECDAKPRFYAGNRPVGRVRWDASQWDPARDDPSGVWRGAGCRSVGHRSTISPGDTLTAPGLRYTRQVDHILGDTLPSGPYAVVADFVINGNRYTVPAGDVVLARGPKVR